MNTFIAIALLLGWWLAVSQGWLTGYIFPSGIVAGLVAAALVTFAKPAAKPSRKPVYRGRCACGEGFKTGQPHGKKVCSACGEELEW